MDGRLSGSGFLCSRRGETRSPTPMSLQWNKRLPLIIGDSWTSADTFRRSLNWPN
jgi:hypothetical protein